MRTWSTAVAAAAVVVAMAGAPASRPATVTSPASGWSPAVTLSGALNASAVAAGAPPSVAVADNGVVRVVWSQKQRVMTVTKHPGHGWSTPRTLYRSAAGAPVAPQVAVDHRGSQVVVWTQGHTVRALRRPAGHSWQMKPVTIAVLPPHQRVLSWIRLVVGDDGTAAVAFWRGRIGRCASDMCRLRHVSAFVVTRRPAGSWQVPSRFAGPVDPVWGFRNPSQESGHPLVETPAAVVYESGTVTVGWPKPSKRRPSWATGPVFVRTLAPGAEWSATQRLSRVGQRRSFGFGSDVALAATSWGDVVAAWGWQGAGAHQLVETRTKPDGGSWEPRQRVFSSGPMRGLGIDEAGNATVLVVGSDDLERPGTFVRERPRGGSWSRLTPVTPAFGVWEADLAVNGTGEGVVAVLRTQGPVVTVLASYHVSGTPWVVGTPLGGAAAPLLTTAVGEDDTAVVVWYRFAGERQRVVVMKAAVRRG